MNEQNDATRETAASCCSISKQQGDQDVCCDASAKAGCCEDYPKECGC